jgi:hypothetical protein
LGYFENMFCIVRIEKEENLYGFSKVFFGECEIGIALESERIAPTAQVSALKI